MYSISTERPPWSRYSRHSLALYLGFQGARGGPPQGTSTPPPPRPPLWTRGCRPPQTLGDPGTVDPCQACVADFFFLLA